MTIDRDVTVPMRDGVRLATDVYRPLDEDPHPVLILRLPYGKDDIHLVGTLLFSPDDAVRRGYAVVVQDVRGTNGSEGVFEPYRQERADGHDTVRWLLSQPWCDGSLGAYGASYMGGAALQLTVGAPDALKATIAYIAPVSFHAEAYVNGMFEAGKNVRWAVSQAAAQIARQKDARRDPAPALSEISRHLHDPKGFVSSSFDLTEVIAATAEWMPFIDEYLRRRDYDEYWKQADVLPVAGSVNTPVLSIAGWLDPFLRSTLQLFEKLTKDGPADLLGKHRLLIGPWTHEAYLGSTTSSSAGSRIFGPAARGGRLGLKALALGWFDKWLRGMDAETPPEPIRYFDMGRETWKDATAWPPSATEDQRWYLASGGRAISASGDGLLTSQRTSIAPSDSYIYDPTRPAPTVGGRSLLYYEPAGMQDQRRVQARDDVAVYTSSILTRPIEVIGQVRLELFVRSSAPTTDFVVVLSDVDDSGAAMSIVEGTFRLPVGDHSVLPFGCTVDLWHTAYAFQAGHRLRVHITSSSFPRFERNRNVSPDAPRASWSVAVQEIVHDDRHPTALVLPVHL